jgi:hypothetical protein
MHVHITYSGCYAKAIVLQAMRVANTRDDRTVNLSPNPFPQLSILCRQKHHDWSVAIQVAAPDLGLRRREVLD